MKLLIAFGADDGKNLAIKLIHNNMDRIVEEKNKGEERKKQIILIGKEEKVLIPWYPLYFRNC